MKTTNENKDTWIYISPIYSLEITEAMNQEITIGKVTFVNIKKIPYIRKRLGLPVTFSKLKEKFIEKDFFKLAKTYAFLTFRGYRHDNYNCQQIVDDAVNILSFSQFGYKTRNNNSQIGLIRQHDIIRDYIINKKKFKGRFNQVVESKVLTLQLNDKWKNFHNRFFFSDLINFISNNKKNIQAKWKEAIIRACIMAGKNYKSRDKEYCFLWNMIIIEMLLTERGDKYSERLPERTEAFIGWVGYWKTKNFEEKIRDLYNKRCQFVHDGNSKNITVEDVIFTDDLVFNLLWNIIKHIKIFPSKQSVIDFSDKVKAEKLLGLKTTVQPKTFRYLNREYDINNYKRI